MSFSRDPSENLLLVDGAARAVQHQSVVAVRSQSAPETAKGIVALALGERRGYYVRIPRGSNLHFEQKSGVLDEGAEDEQDAYDDPGLDGGQALRLRDVGRDSVENVHQHEEHRHQQRHPAGDNVWKKTEIRKCNSLPLREIAVNCTRRDEERDPGDDDKHSRWQVVRDDVVGHLAAESQLEAGDGKVAWRKKKTQCILIS